MSDIIALADAMKRSGQPDSAILAAVLALEAARADKLEQRRQSDRERQRKRRGKPDDQPPPNHVMSRDAETNGTGETPDPQGFSPTPPFPKPPLSSLISSASTREERLALQRELQSNHWQDILTACRKRANGSLDPISSGVLHAGDLIQLIAPLDGPGCDLEADMFPAIDVQVARHHKTGKPIRSWSWIKDDAVANRNRRLAGLPPVEIPDASRHERSSAAGGRPAYRGRGPAQDLIGEALAHLVGGPADPDIIEHTGPVRARAAAGGV